MQFHATKAGSAGQKTACAIVGIHENAIMTAAARAARSRKRRRHRTPAPSVAISPARAARRSRSSRLRRGPAERLLLVGLGPQSAVSDGRPTAGRSSRQRSGSRRAARRMPCPTSRASRFRDSSRTTPRGMRSRACPMRSTAFPISRPRRSRRARSSRASELPCRTPTWGPHDRGIERWPRHCRRWRADAGPRQPAGKRLHADLPRGRREGPRERAQERPRQRARRARDPATRDGLVPLGHARLG